MQRTLILGLSWWVVAQSQCLASPLTVTQSMERPPLRQRVALVAELVALRSSVPPVELRACARRICAPSAVVRVSGSFENMPLPMALKQLGRATGIPLSVPSTGRIWDLRVDAVFERRRAESAIVLLLERFPWDVYWIELPAGVFEVRNKGRRRTTLPVRFGPLEDADVIARSRSLAHVGEAAFGRWAGSFFTDLRFRDEALENLQAAANLLGGVLYKPRGPYVEPRNPTRVRWQHEDTESELFQWRARLRDLHKISR